MSAEANRSAAIAGRGACGTDQGGIAELPTYGYRRVHAILKREALAAGLKLANHKRACKGIV